MRSNWGTAPLGELLELVIDHRGKTPKKLGFEGFHNSGYPVLSAKHVKTSGLVNVDTIRFANIEMYEKWMKVPIKKGDVVLTSEAPMGQVFYLNGQTKYVLGQRVFGLRTDKELINPLYLVAWLTSRRGQGLMSARASGSTVLGIKQSELLKIEVDLPPLHIQEKIAKIQDAFTKKIQLNHQTNQTLEQIAQTIFKCWFVDFKPVKAKQHIRNLGGNKQQSEHAAQAIISGATTLETVTSATDLYTLDQQITQALNKKLAHQSEAQRLQLTTTASYFPAKLVKSELGLIPEGWESCVRLESFLTLAYGKALKKTDRIPGPYSVYGSGGITGSHNNYLVQGPGVIIGRKGTVGSLYWEDGNFHPIDTVFYVKPKNQTALSFIFYLLRTLRLERMNTDAAVPGLNRNNAYQLTIPNFPLHLINLFAEHANTIRENIGCNNVQTQTLSSLRDLLLPKLLAGEVRIDRTTLTDNITK